MDAHQQLLARLAQDDSTKIVLLVLDGVGDLVTAAQPRTALEVARTPHLDALAAGASLGRIVPVAPGVTPGSGPGHLALFGYDPATREADVGRGVLEALGLGLSLAPGDLAVRGNFATADREGRLTDRRAGRLPTEECRRVTARMQAAIAAADLGDLVAEVHPGEAHRFVLLLRGLAHRAVLVRGAEMSLELADTDPQELGVPPLPPRATSPAAEPAAAQVARLVAVMEAAIADEPKANRVLLRGFSTLPHLPSFRDLYHLRAAAFAGYPLYRGVASACGMEVEPCGKQPGDLVDAVARRWADFDFFFLHVKQTDQAGEDGDFAAKVAAIEAVDAVLPRLLELAPDVVAVTGDHSTPASMRGHSWHPVPVLIAAATAFADGVDRFDERAAISGHLGTFPARYLMGLLLAHAGRLGKYGA